MMDTDILRGYTVFTAKDSENNEEMVIFKAKQISKSSWAVPLSMWNNAESAVHIPKLMPNIIFNLSVTPNSIYRHYKRGDMYSCVVLARHLQTKEEVIVYRAEYGDMQIWTRPLRMWDELIPEDKQTNLKQDVRFKKF